MTDFSLNFIKNGTGLPYPKSDLRSLLPSEAPSKHYTAQNWNTLCQAVIDIRSYINDPTGLAQDVGQVTGVYVSLANAPYNVVANDPTKAAANTAGIQAAINTYNGLNALLMLPRGSIYVAQDGTNNWFIKFGPGVGGLTLAGHGKETRLVGQTTGDAGESAVIELDQVNGVCVRDLSIEHGIIQQPDPAQRNFLIRVNNTHAGGAGLAGMTRNILLENLHFGKTFGDALAFQGGSSSDNIVSGVWCRNLRFSCFGHTMRSWAPNTVYAVNDQVNNTKITCVVKANLVDGETVTIADVNGGVMTTKVYEFDVAGDGVTSGNVQVNVSTDTTAAQVAARLRTAILATQPTLSVTNNADGTLTLAGVAKASEAVADAGFVVSANSYVCTTGGASAASGGPAGTGVGITDGAAVWSSTNGIRFGARTGISFQRGYDGLYFDGVYVERVQNSPWDMESTGAGTRKNMHARNIVLDKLDDGGGNTGIALSAGSTSGGTAEDHVFENVTCYEGRIACTYTARARFINCTVINTRTLASDSTLGVFEGRGTNDDLELINCTLRRVGGAAGPVIDIENANRVTINGGYFQQNTTNYIVKLDGVNNLTVKNRPRLHYTAATQASSWSGILHQAVLANADNTFIDGVQITTDTGTLGRAVDLQVRTPRSMQNIYVGNLKASGEALTGVYYGIGTTGTPTPDRAPMFHNIEAPTPFAFVDQSDNPLPPWTVQPRGDLNLKDFGAKGDGTTDDRDALTAAMLVAARTGMTLRIPPGNYKLSKYVDCFGLRGVKIIGSAFATILFASDDTGVTSDSVAVSNEMARSGLLLRNCSNVTIENLLFRGGTAQNLTNNCGGAVYLTKTVGFTMIGVQAWHGYSLLAQDATTGTTGTGDSIAVSGGVATLTDAAGSFVAGHVGRRIAIAGADERNNGEFVIETVISATQITYLNADAVNETVSLTWAIDDNDRDTKLIGCRSYRQRGFTRTGNDAVISGCHFERPVSTLDLCGLGDSYSLSGTTITLKDAASRFRPEHVGKIITTAGSTSAANNVTTRITGYVSSSEITFENASGVTELHPGTWWIANGEKTGLGGGVGALSKSGSTMTLTSDEAAFTANDVGKVLRIAKATTGGNNVSAVITAFVSSTQIQYVNASGASEAFSGIWTIDSYDNGTDGSSTYGSSHGIYIFAGRTNVKVTDCTFRGIRTVAVKGSGSAAPERGILVEGNTFFECGEAFEAGADDSQEHTGLSFVSNLVIDCGTNRPGASLSHAVSILGSRSVHITDNKFHYTRNSTGSVDGRGVAGIDVFQTSRYVPGVSQPVVDITFARNKLTVEPVACTAGNLWATPISFSHVGITAFYRTGGTLTKSGNVMTLTDASAKFSSQLIGRSITLVNSTGGNDGTFTIESVPSTSTLTYTNAGGAGGGNSAGTYRIPERTGLKAGWVRFEHNELECMGGIIQFTSCVAPEIVHNTFSNAQINLSGDCTPRVAFNREVGASTQNARIRLASGTSWPIVHDNTVTNNGIGSSSARDFSVGITSASVDYPLLGKRGRCRMTGAQSQLVVPYGSLHVNGDTIVVNGTTYTYRVSGPTGNEFNSLAGLITLIAAQAGIDCVEYGTHLTPSVATGHLLIYSNAAGAADGGISVTVSTLNPTAFPLLRNNNGANLSCNSRGAGSAGPVDDKTCVWSPLVTYPGSVTLVADNSQAQTLLAASGYRSVGSPAGAAKLSDDAGCVELIQIAASAGASVEEFRWTLN